MKRTSTLFRPVIRIYLRTKSACFLAVMLMLVCGGTLSADVTIVQRDSSSRLRVFTGSGGAANIDDVQDSTDVLTGVFSFDAEFDSFVTEDDPFSNGAASANGAVSVTDNVMQPGASEIALTSSRTSSAFVQYISGTGSATSGPRHTFRVRFMVSDDPVRYTVSGTFNPGAIVNGATSVSLYRPFTSNIFFEYESSQVLDETGVLQPGLTYEFRVIVNDLLSAGASNPGPTSEVSSYDLDVRVAPILLGDVNLDGMVNLLDVEPFVSVISNGDYQIEADIDQNGIVNLLDVGPFIELF